MAKQIISKLYHNHFYGNANRPLTVKKRKGSYSLHAQLYVTRSGQIYENATILYIHPNHAGNIVGMLRKWKRQGDLPIYRDVRVIRIGAGAWTELT